MAWNLGGGVPQGGDMVVLYAAKVLRTLSHVRKGLLNT